jgi:hypothetical protein
MKKLLPFLSLAFLAACNSNPDKAGVSTTPVTQQAPVQTLDTTGYAKYQDWKAQNELVEIKEYNEPEQQKAAPVARVKRAYKAPVRKAAPVASAPKKKAAVRKPVSTNSGSGSTASAGSGTEMNNEGSNSAKAPAVEEKGGWSKTAKGTVIGAGGGAVIGAVINKKNRAAGAVIGGVLGAGVGYGLGKVLDKKEAAKKAEVAQIN